MYIFVMQNRAKFSNNNNNNNKIDYSVRNDEVTAQALQEIQ